MIRRVKQVTLARRTHLTRKVSCPRNPCIPNFWTWARTWRWSRCGMSLMSWGRKWSSPKLAGKGHWCPWCEWIYTKSNFSKAILNVIPSSFSFPGYWKTIKSEIYYKGLIFKRIQCWIRDHQYIKERVPLQNLITPEFIGRSQSLMVWRCVSQIPLLWRRYGVSAWQYLLYMTSQSLRVCLPVITSNYFQQANTAVTKKLQK